MHKLIFLTVIFLIGCGTLPRVDNLTFEQGEATEADYSKALEDCREFAEQAAKQRAQWIERRHIASPLLATKERCQPSLDQPLGGSVPGQRQRSMTGVQEKKERGPCGPPVATRRSSGQLRASPPVVPAPLFERTSRTLRSPRRCSTLL